MDERGDDVFEESNSGCESDKTCSGYNEVCCKRPSSTTATTTATTTTTTTTKVKPTDEAPSNWIETPVDSSVRQDALSLDFNLDPFVSNSPLLSFLWESTNSLLQSSDPAWKPSEEVSGSCGLPANAFFIAGVSIVKKISKEHFFKDFIILG